MVKVCQLVIAWEHAIGMFRWQSAMFPTHLKHAKACPYGFDEITFQAHLLHALQSYKKNQNCFYHPEIVCRRQKKV